MNLNQSSHNLPSMSILPSDQGWQIHWSEALVDRNSHQLVCERVASHVFDKPVPLQYLLESDGQSAELSYASLERSLGVPVDQYSHPVLALNIDQPANRQQFRAAPRPIPMTATANFRDYGGYLTDSGQQVVWGKLFRTGHMGDMSADDIRAISQLNIQTVLDFRRLEEAANQPSQLPQGLQPTSIVISPGSSIDLFSAIMDDGIDEAKIDQFMQEINHDLAISHQASYRQMFDALLTHRDSGSIIHCSAGKDRTGFGGLLVLGALGVNRQTIMQDYLLTNEHVNLDREIARWTKNYSDTDWSKRGGDSAAENVQPKAFNRDALAVILKVKASYLQTAMDTIDNEFGGLERYLKEQIGLEADELAALHQSYLY